MVKINDLVNYTQQLMQVECFKDYCPNGLQVEGKSDVCKIVTGVTANMALLNAAKQAQADLVLVHHGFFWKNEEVRIVGIKKTRIKFLLENDLNLMAYHLPLDAHQQLGNNVQLGRIIGVDAIDYVGEANLIAYGYLAQAMTLGEFVEHLGNKLGRTPLVMGDLNKIVHKIAWCTGAAQGYFNVAIGLAVDVYISGEISEQTMHQAVESGVSYISAGHHATERYGVQALGEHLAEKFNLNHEFIDINNPV